MGREVAFITTVFNEKETIELLLESLRKQSRKPDEVIIVDGGSTDGTVNIINSWRRNLKNGNFKKKVRFISKKGNRSVGRNEAVRLAKSNIIISSDAGCILDKNFIKNISLAFRNSRIDVVSGFYKGLANSIFQKALIPYTLVMHDKVNPRKFLPSARSMAFTKDVWMRTGGFPEEYSFNEDYVFAKRLRRINANIVFKRNAFVLYIPRKNLTESFIMFFKFAFGDAQSGILRPKAMLIFIRYIFVAWLIVYSYFFQLSFIVKAILYILVSYMVWSIWKNYRYVKSKKAFILLPILQFTSDIAIILGTISGFFNSLWDTQRRR